MFYFEAGNQGRGAMSITKLCAWQRGASSLRDLISTIMIHPDRAFSSYIPVPAYAPRGKSSMTLLTSRE